MFSILICTLSHAPIHIHSHICSQLSPPYTYLFEFITLCLYLHMYKILSLWFLPSKESGTSPNGQINISLSFKHLPEQISIPLLVYVDMERGICFLTGPLSVILLALGLSVGSWSCSNLNRLAKSLHFSQMQLQRLFLEASSHCYFCHWQMRLVNENHSTVILWNLLSLYKIDWIRRLNIGRHFLTPCSSC